MQRSRIFLGLTLSFLVAGCAKNDTPEPVVNEFPDAANPLMIESELLYGMPPFDRIRDEHFVPAFESGMAE